MEANALHMVLLWNNNTPGGPTGCNVTVNTQYYATGTIPASGALENYYIYALGGNGPPAPVEEQPNSSPEGGGVSTGATAAIVITLAGQVQTDS